MFCHFVLGACWCLCMTSNGEKTIERYRKGMCHKVTLSENGLKKTDTIAEIEACTFNLLDGTEMQMYTGLSK